MTSIKNMIKAKMNSDRNDDGFTLVELIVVILIIAILAVVGLIVLSNVQDSARDSAVEAAAANGLTSATAISLQGGEVTDADLSAVGGDDINVTITGGGGDVDGFCVTATHTEGNEAEAGQGC